MSEGGPITAAILVIGDEILSGRTSDKNINHIARHLALIGIRLREVRVVPDVEAEIVEAVNHLRKRFGYLFTTGGIGPTHDDITADSVARAFGVDIDIDPRAVEMMRNKYEEDQLTGDRMRMARIPHGAELVANPLSHTPGFMLDNVVVMAGIPGVMQCMLDEVTPLLRKGIPLQSLTLRAISPESELAASLRAVQDDFPDLSLGSYPFIKEGVMGADLVLRGAEFARLEAAGAAIANLLHRQGIACSRVDGD